ncbi:hypothetical protein H6F50_22040 [Coleofasciculus sp. FACHB-712]|uniref:hypothetical protein n=1 Tax=Coleofasciculus sp. FACHB-712 TaxID=2692789 RepID=UPI0016842953|nr:hypothetical protein [Coleofasciculus sp. FACHB-712]MBD1945002.1 hypothetical protein [Coleofasciculus sp. FACHB-712]
MIHHHLKAHPQTLFVSGEGKAKPQELWFYTLSGGYADKNALVAQADLISPSHNFLIQLNTQLLASTTSKLAAPN